MLGVIVNTAAVFFGGLLGLFLGRGIGEETRKTMMQVLGLATMLIGLKNALAFRDDDLMIIIASLIVGTILGTWIGLEAKVEGLGRRLEGLFSGKGEAGRLGKAFVTASLVFCVGSMAIVGAMESGLIGTHETFFAKSALDGVIAVIFAASMGVGVVLAAVTVLLYQGGLTLLASGAREFLTPEVIAQMTATGGLLVFAIGFNLMEVTRIRIANLLPAIFMPPIFFGVVILVKTLGF